MSLEGTVALAALIIAVVALIPAVLQALQQYIATSEGYRRCQAPVIGSWSKMTRRRFRARELRFETLYAVPKFTIVTWWPKVAPSTLSAPPDFCEDLGLVYQRPEDFTAVRRHDESTTWLDLTSALYGQHQAFEINFGARGPQPRFLYLGLPYMSVLSRSWDFVPPDVTRPLATTKVGDLVRIARRLGMNWIELDPVQGKFLAEGCGQTITSYKTQGVGTVVQYHREDRAMRDHSILSTLRYLSFTERADLLSFGVLGGPYTVFEGLNISSLTALSAPQSPLMSELSMNKADELAAMLSSYLDKDDSLCWGLINDLVSLWVPYLGHATLCIVSYPRARIRGMIDLVHYPRFVSGVQDFIREKGDNASEYIKRLNGRMIALRSAFSELIPHQDCIDFENLDLWSVKWKDQVLQALTDAESRTFDVMYYRSSFSLLAMHIHTAIKEYQGISDHGELFPLLFKALPGNCKVVSDKSPEIIITVEDLEDLWLALVFRAFCWQSLHIGVESTPFARAWLDSSIPVYIA